MHLLSGLVKGDFDSQTDITSPLPSELVAQRAVRRLWLLGGGAIYLTIAIGAIFLR